MHNSAKKIIKQFHDNQEIYRSLKHDIDDIFTRIIDTNHFRISNMAIRIKSEDALMKKITYKNRYQDINEITDVVACRIITLFENDVDRIYECVKDNFEVLEYNDLIFRKKILGEELNNINKNLSGLFPIMFSDNSKTEELELTKNNL